MSSRRLYRSRTECKIAGVCGGLAEYFDTDPVLIRLLSIALLFVGVPTPIIYIVCWAVLPQGPPAHAAQSGPSAAGAEATAGAPAGSAGTAADSMGMHPGGSHASDAGAHRTHGALILGLVIFWSGVFFLCLNLGIFDWSIFGWWRLRYLWPLALVGIGVMIILRSFSDRRDDR